MKAEMLGHFACPQCRQFLLQNPLPGEFPRIARCECGFRCLVPTVDVVPCDADGNALPDGFATVEAVEQARWVTEQELG